jgi:hypothetical protein
MKGHIAHWESFACQLCPLYYRYIALQQAIFKDSNKRKYSTYSQSFLFCEIEGQCDSNSQN